MILKNALNKVISNFIDDYNNRNFIPILESDVVSHLYHLWADRYGSKRIHVDTRICSKPGPFFDIVIGNVNRAGDKPCINEPELVIEVKFFVEGFSPQQLRKRFFQVLEKDIRKLASLNKPRETRFILLFDEAGYLHGHQRNDPNTRLEKIQGNIEKIEKNINIILLEKRIKLEYSLL